MWPARRVIKRAAKSGSDGPRLFGTGMASLQIGPEGSSGRLVRLATGLHLRPVEIQVRARRSRAALVLVARAVDGGAVRVFGGGTGPEQAQLADLHPRPQLDRQ